MRRGYLIMERLTEQFDKVQAQALGSIGPLRFFGYDIPWQLLSRQNELVVWGEMATEETIDQAPNRSRRYGA